MEEQAPAGLSEIIVGATLEGVSASGPVKVISVESHGPSTATVSWREPSGGLSERLLFTHDLPSLRLVGSRPKWRFDADAASFVLASEARRLKLAYLFDPWTATSSSAVRPLPHQIRAVYQEMLPRQPLRFLLADDPGAGKTIMAGLLMKELLLRGDLRRGLIVAPGSLTEQWQDELFEKVGIECHILTKADTEASRTGNPFADKRLVIARLDMLSRNPELAQHAASVPWDLVVVDEAHKMSARYFGNELKKTKRYELGELLGRATRHLLLMTATPHSGDQESFGLFMSLLDSDRFHGRDRDATRVVDADDMMRRMLKEDLLTFEGKPLFPERRAYTAEYDLSDAQAVLYEEVTDYVKEEMNRADRLGDGQGRRRNAVGFALTILQRRLASSPEAIYQSLRRRKEKLQGRLREATLVSRVEDIVSSPTMSDDDVEDFEDLSDEEREDREEELVDSASAAATVAELEAEIATLNRLVDQAVRVRDSRTDAKWDQLRQLLTDQPEMFDGTGHRRKVIVFTEHRDTLNYLRDRLVAELGRPEAVVEIHGGVSREKRKEAQGLFTSDPDVVFLVATDAAGEGVNLQRAHLLINYDLPWNPNRIEQRFGRVHRIGQTEVCHMWNLVAAETREGAVFARLLAKIEIEKGDLQGRVYDVLGEVFRGSDLKDLLINAIRYGEDPARRIELERIVDAKVADGLREVIAEQALHEDVLSHADIDELRIEMERAAAQRLQPFYIEQFFTEAFKRLGGRLARRESERFEITHVPAIVRERDRTTGSGAPVLTKYERVVFEPDFVAVVGRPLAQLIAPGHPLFDSVVDLTLERMHQLLQQGTVLVDPTDHGIEPRLLVYLEHTIEDGRPGQDGRNHVVSRQFQFVQMPRKGQPFATDGAPYLDYVPATDEELAETVTVLRDPWLADGIEERALNHALATIVPSHVAAVVKRTSGRVEKTEQKVKERLLREIAHWDHRAEVLFEQEQAGKQPRINSQNARQRADDLRARLDRRLVELGRERMISPQQPVVVGAALVVPAGMLTSDADSPPLHPADTERSDRLAVAAVLATEAELDRVATEMAHNHPGYDIESLSNEMDMFFIEVKGRVQGATTVHISKNQILTGLNKPEQFILALVQVQQDDSTQVRYLRQPFQGSPRLYFNVAGVDFEWTELWNRASNPT
jgi:superfamily II DNA or RNA helicase